MSESDSTLGDTIAFLAIIGVAVFGIQRCSQSEPEPPVFHPTPIERPARPEGMVYVTTIDNGSVWSIDADTVKGTRKERQGWLTENHAKDNSTIFRETKSLWVTDCDKGSYSRLETVSYKPDGDPVNLDLPEEVSYAVPGTNAAAVVDSLCFTGFGP